MPPHLVSVIFKRPGKVRLNRRVLGIKGAGLAVSLASIGQHVRSFVSDYARQVLEYPAPDSLAVESLVAEGPVRNAILPVPVKNLFPQLDLLLPDDEHL